MNAGGGRTDRRPPYSARVFSMSYQKATEANFKRLQNRSIIGIGVRRCWFLPTNPNKDSLYCVLPHGSRGEAVSLPR